MKAFGNSARRSGSRSLFAFYRVPRSRAQVQLSGSHFPALRFVVHSARWALCSNIGERPPCPAAYAIFSQWGTLRWTWKILRAGVVRALCSYISTSPLYSFFRSFFFPVPPPSLFLAKQVHAVQRGHNATEIIPLIARGRSIKHF